VNDWKLSVFGTLIPVVDAGMFLAILIFDLGKGYVPITGLAAPDPATEVTVTIGLVAVACFFDGRRSSPAWDLRFLSDMTKQISSTGRCVEVKEYMTRGSRQVKRPWA